MNRFKSIPEQGGLKLYLNAKRHDHNGLGYDDLELRLRLKTPKAQIAKDFGVSYTTLNRTWLPLVKEEDKYKLDGDYRP